MLRQANSISLRAFLRCSKNSGGRNALILSRISSRAARACWRTSSGILPSKGLRRVVFSSILASLSYAIINLLHSSRYILNCRSNFRLQIISFIWYTTIERLVGQVESTGRFEPPRDPLNRRGDVVVRNVQSQTGQTGFYDQLAHQFLLTDEWIQVNYPNHNTLFPPMPLYV